MPAASMSFTNWGLTSYLCLCLSSTEVALPYNCSADKFSHQKMNTNNFWKVLTDGRFFSGKNGFSLSKTHRAAHLSLVVLGHIDNHWIGGFWVDFSRIGIVPVQNVSHKFDGGHLQAKADAQEWLLRVAAPQAGLDHALDATLSKATRNNDATVGFRNCYKLYLAHSLESYLLLQSCCQASWYKTGSLCLVASSRLAASIYCQSIEKLISGLSRVCFNF